MVSQAPSFCSGSSKLDCEEGSSAGAVSVSASGAVSVSDGRFGASSTV